MSLIIHTALQNRILKVVLKQCQKKDTVVRDVSAEAMAGTQFSDLDEVFDRNVFLNNCNNTSHINLIEGS